MATNKACETEILEAALIDEEVEQTLKSMEADQQAMRRSAAASSHEALLEDSIAKPAGILQDTAVGKFFQKIADEVDAKKLTLAEDQSLGGKVLSKLSSFNGTRIAEGYSRVRDFRTSLMLMEPTTSLKNMISTGGMTWGQRPMEEAIAVTMSRMLPGEKRSYHEVMVRYDGLKRGSLDSFQMIRGIAKRNLELKTLAVSDRRVAEALSQSGYPRELSTTSVDLVSDAVNRGDDAAIDAWTLKAGTEFISGAADAPFTSLQMQDLSYKMGAYRGHVQQTLSRRGMREGLHGESLDMYVAENWQRMTEEQRLRDFDAEALIPRRNEDAIVDSGVRDAAESTFTGQSETKLGEILSSGNIYAKGSVDPFRIPGMKLLVPFRGIYVRLMRETFSKRLLAPLHILPAMKKFDPITHAQLRSLDPIVQQTALAKIAGGYIALGATAAVVGATGIKIWGSDEMSPEVRKLQFEQYGKVGNTLQYGDMYLPADALPPTIAIPLQYYMAAESGLNKLRFKEESNPDATTLKKVGMYMGFMTKVVSDGPWVTEYIDFISRMNHASSSGNTEKFFKTFADMALKPVKLPRFVEEALGVNEGDLQDYDSAFDLIRNRFWRGDDERLPNRRGMFGNTISRNTRIGTQSAYPWNGAGEDVSDFLASISYDMAYPSNYSRNVRGDAAKNDQYMSSTADNVRMTAKARDKFGYYTGKAKIGGLDLEQSIRQMMNDPRAGTMSAIQLRLAIRKLHTRFRKNARQLVKIDPELGIREKQIGLFTQMLGKAGVDQKKIDNYRRTNMSQLDLLRRMRQSELK
jgi:hypothetical protein